jgi:nitrogen fixation/metabolism regulation signal transduction histidine kinase
VFDEITVLLQAQREAAWGEVARRLAHEIKNPLTPIQLSAERLRKKYLNADDRDFDFLDRATHTIIQQVDAMKDMVNAFSEYARAPRIQSAPVNVNELVAEVAELYSHQESPMVIGMTFDGDLPVIDADAGRLRQVLHNLMRNSIEATEGRSDARIDIVTRKVDDQRGAHAQILVSDNGPGFSEDIMNRAFYPYVTSKPKGTGLGLAIVKKLVEEHSGSIRVGNTEQGGAYVSILMPVSSSDKEVRSAIEVGHEPERA